MSQKKTICVIGLGYVGLPLAVRSVERGYTVFGFDNDARKVKLINAGKSPIEEKFLTDRMMKHRFTASVNENIISKADIVLICVPTPVDDQYYPDLTHVSDATTMCAKHAKKGTLVVLESTVNPGVSEEVVRPIFEAAGRVVGDDIFIAHSPERINPGDLKWNVTNIPRVVGSFDQKGLKMAIEFYESIIDAEIRPMKSIREAEAVKIVENSFRDINIAFVNELAKSFDILGIDIKEVISAAATKPYAFMPHFPSSGVGGHCIPVDPYYLIERAKKSGFNHKFLKVAREINNSMPEYTVELLQDELNKIKMPLNGTNVCILGISYKANVDDTRESPTFKIEYYLKKHGAIVTMYDPHVLEHSTVTTLDEALTQCDAIILATDHNEFKAIEPSLFKKHNIKVIIDGKNMFDKDMIQKLKIAYKGIGR